MKKHFTKTLRIALAILTSLGFSAMPAWAVEFWNEGFETGVGGTVGGGSTFHTGINDYFTRINDTNGDAAGGETPLIDLDGDVRDEYIGFTGDWYFAAEDTVSNDWRTIDFDIANVSSHENLVFFGDFGAGDTDATPSYDHNHFLAILYSTDGGTNYLPALVFRYGGTDADFTNHPLRRVNTIRPSGRAGFTTLQQVGNKLATGVMATDDQSTGLIFESMGSDENDGSPLTGPVAVGTILNHDLQTFSVGLPNAASLRIRVVMDMDDSHTEVAFDNLRLEGDFLVTNQAPTHVTTTASDIGETEIGDTTYSFTVQYSDNSAVLASTIGAADVTVTGPGGLVPVTSGTTTDPNGTSLTATYTITPPGGDWDAADNGTYNIAVAASQVGDDGGPQLFVAAGAAGSFSVNATNTVPTADTVVALDVPATSFGQSSYTFTVAYSDVGGIDASSIDASDVTVTGPGGGLTVTGGATSDPDGPSVLATYTVSPPGGLWDIADDGLYTIGIVGGQVLDINGASVVADAAAGQFTVDSDRIMCETFETDGGSGARYTVNNGPQFYNNPNAYFTRIRDINGNAAGGETPLIDLDGDTDDEYDDFLGEWYFAVDDVAAGGGSNFRTIDFNQFNTAGHNGISFTGLFGAGDTDANPSYDTEHFLAVLYSTDGGTTYVPGAVFRANVSAADTTNRPFAKVDNVAPSGANGVNTLADLGARLSAGTVVSGVTSGEVFSYMAADSGGNAATGTLLNHGFQQFGFTIPGTPATVDIRVVFQSDELHGEMAVDQLKLTGTFVGLNVAPSAVALFADDVVETDIGETSYSFDVQYGDDSQIVASTIGAADVTVSGPFGVTILTGTTADPDGPSVTGTYTFTPPGGDWDAADNGTYTVSVASNQVGDNGGPQLFVPVGIVGTFEVNATNTAPTVANVAVTNVVFPQFGESSYSFTVTYTDVDEVDASSVGSSDVTVTGPGGPVSISSGTTSDPNGSSVTATYTFTPPGGTWDGADVGVYTVGIVGGEVSDNQGDSAVADATAESFEVFANKLMDEGFENDGEGTRYFTNGGAANHFFEASAATSYFTRVVDNGSGPNPAILLDADPAGTNYSSFDGEAYFAAENVDVGGRPAFRVVDLAPIDTSAFTGLEFMGLFGAGDTDANPGYDTDHFMAVLYSVDSGVSYTPGLVFRANVSAGDFTNKLLSQVDNIAPSGANGINTLADLGAQISTGNIVLSAGGTDIFSYIAADDGTNAAAGTALSPVMAPFMFNVPDAPEVRIRLVLHSDGANIEMAFDSLMVTGSVIPQPPIALDLSRNIGEDEWVDFLAGDFDSGFSDPNVGDTLQTLKITTAPTTGTLYFTGGIVPIVTFPVDIPVGDIAGMRYIPQPNFGGPTATFDFSVSDGALFSVADATYTFNITEENDDPVAFADTFDRFPTSSLKIPVASLLADDSDPWDTPPDAISFAGFSYTSGNGATVTESGGIIFYDPNGYLGDDTFTYSISDARGGTASAAININAIDDDDPVINGPSLNITKIDVSGGQATITAAGIPGRTYRVQAADDFTPPATGWFDLPGGTVVADPATGIISYVDPGPLPPARIYRTVHP